MALLGLALTTWVAGVAEAASADVTDSRLGQTLVGSRLKDVRELFLDTGVGVDAYSVIEQGRVAALLEANVTVRVATMPPAGPTE